MKPTYPFSKWLRVILATAMLTTLSFSVMAEDETKEQDENQREKIEETSADTWEWLRDRAQPFLWALGMLLAHRAGEGST